MKYPIGIQTFEKIIEGGFVYVDKTDLVYKLVTEGNIYFLSRPRRFGKSLLVSTIESYFLGKKELFKGLKIDALEKDWNTYPVFRIDFNGVDFTIADSLKNTLEAFVTTAEREYGGSPHEDSLGKRFEYVLKQAHEKTGRKAVVLIDEYDKPLLDVMDTDILAPEHAVGVKTLEDYNRSILKGFYSVFKSADADLQFVLLTGVTKFSQVSVFSGFNQPNDITMSPKYDALCGITLDEIEEYFGESMEQLAQENELTLDEAKAKLKRMYDGYHFSKKMIDIYNPFSLLKCFSDNDFRCSWFSTGTPDYLMRLMADNDVNIREIINQEYPASEFVDYKADRQMPLPMLYQSGYLTIKGYDKDVDCYALDFPSEEVRSGMSTVLASSYFCRNNEPSSRAVKIKRALLQGKIEDFTNEITSLLAGVSYRFRGKDEKEYERHFQYSFYLIMLMSGPFTLVERETSQGRIDCVVECPKYIYVIEFKRDGSASKALKQIDDKGYVRPYLSDPRHLFKVGINFSTATGTVEEMEYEQIK